MRAALPGMALVLAIMALAIVHEVSLPAGTNHARAVGLIVGIPLDVAALAAVARTLDARGRGSFVVFASALAANAAIGIGWWFAVRVVLVLTVAHEPWRLANAAWGGLGWSFEVYALWAIGFRMPSLVRQSDERRRDAERLREQAELAQLRGHLQPHFLRNTLNAVAALVTEDPQEARRLLATLAELLSDLLETIPAHSLDLELAWLQRYAEILETRHRGKLHFEWHISSNVRERELPTLLLQPLVENAVVHGALCGGGEGVVRVVAAAEGAHLNITIEDNGPGYSEGKDGLGLELVRRRLAVERPGSRLRFESSSVGTRAIVELR